MLGLAVGLDRLEARQQLEELAAATGGRAYFLDSLEGLDAIYRQILVELRSRYLLAFTPAEGATGDFRALQVEVDRSGARILVRRGYAP